MLGIQPRVRYAQLINLDAKTGGRSSRRRASNPESGMLSQSTRMPRPVASPPDAGHPTQSQVCSVYQPGSKSSRRWASYQELGMLSQSTRMPRPAVSLKMQGIQYKVRYAQLINPDAKTGGKSFRRRASNPKAGMLSQVTKMPRPGGRFSRCRESIQPRVRYPQSINPDAKTGGKSSKCRASNPKPGMLSQSAWMSRLAAGPPDAGHPPRVRYAQ
jgi:hypothetical protein